MQDLPQLIAALLADAGVKDITRVDALEEAGLCLLLFALREKYQAFMKQELLREDV